RQETCSRSFCRNATHLLSIVLALGSFSGTMRAQSITGTILGTVYDPSKSVITGAKVSLTSVAQGWTRSDETDSLGNYIFTNLPPGGYSIAVAATGFQTLTVPDVQVLLDQRASGKRGAVAQ